MTTASNMELSILIAQILAVLYLAAGIGGLVSGHYYRRIAEDLFKNSALLFCFGFIAIILGLLIIHYHNIWTWHWRVLITATGWLILMRGILLIAFPELFRRLSKPFFSETALRIFPYVVLLVGLLFGWLGFFQVA